MPVQRKEKKTRQELEADEAAAAEELQALAILAADMEDTFGAWGELVAMYLGRDHEPGTIGGQPNWYEDKHRSGQKFGITAAQTKKLLDNISGGMALGISLQLANIKYGLFREWLKRGGSIKYTDHVDRDTEAEEPYRTFAMLYDVAEGIPEAGALAHVVGSGDWRAHAWFLERRYRERWGADTSKVAVGVTGGTGGGVVIMIPDNGRDGLLEEREEVLEALPTRHIDRERYLNPADNE